MKRTIIVFILVALIAGMSFGLGGGGSDNFDLNAGLSFFFESDLSAKEKALEALILTSVTCGVGYHFNLVPNIAAPGLYADIHLSLLSFLFNNSETSSGDALDDLLFFQFGIRVYNNFTLGPLKLQPFFGINFFIVLGESQSLKTFGILAAFKSFALEYSYQNPLRPERSNKILRDMHRFCVLFRI